MPELATPTAAGPAAAGTNAAAPARAADIVAALRGRSVVLVGMMGAGKSSIGRRLAARLGIPFLDADTEIETAALMTIPEIFEAHGEDYFRAGEARVIARMLESGPQVLGTGGGAYMNADTRAAIRTHGISIWLKADFDVLLRRVRRRTDRPMLKTADPEATLRRLIAERSPLYAEADATVVSREAPHEKIVDELVDTLARHLGFGVAGPGVAGHGVFGVDARRPDEAAPGDLAHGGPAQAGRGEEDRRMMTAATPMTETNVHVALAGRGYDIAIGRGLLPGLGARIAALRRGAAAAIVTDETVAGHHLEAAEAALAAAGIRCARIVVPPGESTKSWPRIEQVCDALLTARIERGDLVVALGGGVVGDLSGFAAAITRRGLDVVQVPTTLLAQVDSSVGGKTGINSSHGKNLIGAFHQPAMVLADTALLDTLPLRDFRAGYAEVAKYGLMNDPAFFAWLEANWREVFSGGPARDEAIAVCCRSKAEIVARDERENGDRALLNLGHTFGHALEAGAGFSTRLLHGEAVALGMVLAFGFSARLGLTSADEVERVTAHLATVGLPVHLSEVPGGLPGLDRLMDLMAQDKKVHRGQLTFILVRGIGRAYVARDVDPAEVRAFLAEKLG